MDEKETYKKIYNLVIACGTEKNQISFMKVFLAELKTICFYDIAWVTFLDGSGKDIDWIIENDDLHWRWLYPDYYAKDTSFRFKQIKDRKEDIGAIYLEVIDWEMEEGMFVDDYMKKRNIRHSVAFPFFDNNGVVNCIVRLDLNNQKKFSETEIEELRRAIAPVNLLFKRFFQVPESGRQQVDTGLLTRREKEISDLLCSGVPVNKIGEHCHISTATVRKHIEHLYRKLGVSSLQEFLILMLKK